MEHKRSTFLSMQHSVNLEVCTVQSPLASETTLAEENYLTLVNFSKRNLCQLVTIT